MNILADEQRKIFEPDISIEERTKREEPFMGCITELAARMKIVFGSALSNNQTTVT